MSKFKPFIELGIVPVQEHVALIDAKTGSVVGEIEGISAEIADRLVECWNACRKIAYPDAHIKATDDYIGRLEKLLKDAAVARQEQKSSGVES